MIDINSFFEDGVECFKIKKGYILGSIFKTILLVFIGFYISKIISFNNFKSGLGILNFISVVGLIFSVIYAIWYNIIKNKHILLDRFRYLFLSINLSIFLLYYNSNYDRIIESVEYEPNWISKSTFIFLVYLMIYIVINIIIMGIVSNKINNLKLNSSGIEIKFSETPVGKLENISSNINNVIAKNTILIDNMDEIVAEKFQEVNLYDELDLDEYLRVYENMVNQLFSDISTNVSVKCIRIIHREDVDNEEVDEMKSIIDLIFDNNKESIILKVKSIEAIKNGEIVRIDKYIFVPIKINNMQNIFVVEFDNVKNTIADYGNIIYTLLKHLECSIIKYLSEKELETSNA